MPASGNDPEGWSAYEKFTLVAGDRLLLDRPQGRSRPAQTGAGTPGERAGGGGCTADCGKKDSGPSSQASPGAKTSSQAEGRWSKSSVELGYQLLANQRQGDLALSLSGD